MTRTLRCPPDAKHIAPARPDAQRLDWKRSDGSEVRSIEATCTLCNPTLVYELVRIGGLLRIRRTNTATLEVHVTANATSREAEQAWPALLAGFAQ